LKDANETFIFIGSGTQILPFDKLITEAWYATSRKRLFDLIIKYEKSGIVFLTGDIHCAEILKTFCTLPELGYDLFEITSSGLSHYCDYKLLLDHIFPNNYNTGAFINDYNFAFIEFNWGNSKDDASMNIQIKDIDNKVIIEKIINYQDLRFKESYNIEERNNSLCYQKINSRFKNFNDYTHYYMQSPKKIIPFLILLLILYFIFYAVFYLFRKMLRTFYQILKSISLSFLSKKKTN